MSVPAGGTAAQIGVAMDNDHIVVVSCAPGRKPVAVVVGPTCSGHVVATRASDTGVAAVKLRVGSRTLWVGSAHLPPVACPEYREALDTLRRELPECPWILGADINADLRFQTFDDVPAASCEAHPGATTLSSLQRAELFGQWLRRSRATLPQLVLPCLAATHCSWGQRNWTIKDYFVCHKGVAASVRSCEVLTACPKPSDHLPVLLSLRFEGRPRPRARRARRPVFEPESQQQYQETLQLALASRPGPPCDPAQRFHGLVTTCMQATPSAARGHKPAAAGPTDDDLPQAVLPTNLLDQNDPPRQPPGGEHAAQRLEQLAEAALPCDKESLFQMAYLKQQM